MISLAIKILSDSACDLPKEILEEFSIDILPIMVIKDESEYLDGVTIYPKDVYDNMRNGVVYTTAQIPLNMFNEKFTGYATNDDSVIYIAFSSGLSGTYQSAVFSKDIVLEKHPNLDLDIVDTKAASGGFGLIVLHAARLAKEGKTKGEILEAIDFLKNNMQYIFTVDDIEYLFRGGRISRTQAFIGGLLNIKPVLHVDDGKLIPLEKTRGKNKVFKRILDIMEERGSNIDWKNQLVCITHGDDIEGATKLRDLIKERFGVENFLINIIGAAIGVHSGPGTLAIFFLSKDY